METVLYKVAANNPKPHDDNPKKPREPNPATYFFERTVFGIARVFILCLSAIVLFALAMVLVVFVTTLVKERRARTVTFDEVSTSIVSAAKVSKEKAILAKKIADTIPQNVQEAFSKNKDGLDSLLEDIREDQKDAFLNNLSDVISQAKAAGVDGSKMGKLADEVKILWRMKLLTEEASENARLILRASTVATGFSLLLILTTLCMILVMLAIERNTRQAK